MTTILQQVWFGNTLERYVIAGGILLLGVLGVWIISHVIQSRLKPWAARTATGMDDALIKATRQIGIPFLYLSVFMTALASLHLPPLASKIVAILWSFFVMVTIVRVVLALVNHAVFGVWIKKRDDHLELERQMRAIMPIFTIVAWGIAIVLLLDNLGFKITAVVAGLGVTGVAVALAAQAILGDMFGYMAIMLDRPFEIDDFIVVGDMMGTVEYVGIKTTRIRSLSGEQLVFSNKDITDSRVRNYRRMELRRIEFSIGLAYHAPAEKVRRAISIIREAVEASEKTRLDRVHFAAYQETQLKIEVVYFVLSADYNTYMDIQQDVNLRIHEAFDREDIPFAFPLNYVQRPAGGAKPKAVVA